MSDATWTEAGYVAVPTLTLVVLLGFILFVGPPEPGNATDLVLILFSTGLIGFLTMIAGFIVWVQLEKRYANGDGEP